MDDETSRSQRAGELVEQADAVLGQLAGPGRLRLADRLPPGQIGRLLVTVGVVACTALAAATVAIVLTVVQFNTRVDLARAESARAVATAQAAQRENSEALRASVCGFLEAFVVLPGQSGPTGPYGLRIAAGSAALASRLDCPAGG